MSQKVTIIKDTKTPSTSSFTSSATKTTITTTSNFDGVVRNENDSMSVIQSNVNFKSSMMRNYIKKNSSTNLNFDDLQCEMDQEYLELKDYFIYKAIGDRELYSTVCISDLSELNRKHDDSVKTKLYSAVI